MATDRVPYSRNSPAYYKGSNTALLTNGGLEFKDTTTIHPYAGDPNGVLTLPKGSIVLDKVNSKVWQNLLGTNTYAQVGAAGGGVSFDANQFSGDGSGGSPITLTGAFFPTVDSDNASYVMKADGLTPVWKINTTDVQAVLDGKINLGKVDAFGRTMIWNYGTNSVIKLGGLQQEGDPADVSSEGVVIVGANSAGTFDATNWALVRLKSTHIGINNCIANVQNYIFRADETSLYLRNDAGTKTFEVSRSTGNVTTDSGIFKPRVDSTTAIKFTKADGTTNVLTVDTSTPKTTTDYPIVVQGTDILPAINKKLDAFKGTIAYPKEGSYLGTTYSVIDEASLSAAIASAVTGDTILLTADITVTTMITINKSIKIDGSVAGRLLQSVGGVTDPVFLITVTAANVTLGSNLTIWHKKTLNTSNECAVSVNALGFVSYAYVRFVEFGYILRGSFSIHGPMLYSGSGGNNHRFVAVYRIDAPSQVNGVVWDFASENPARASFVYVTSSLASDKFNAVLRVAFTRQLNETRQCRQFYMQDAFLTDAAGVNPAVIIEGNTFNDQNGGIGFYAGISAPLNFFAYIAAINNWQGDASIASYKGMIYFDGTTPFFDLGASYFYYGGNRHPTTIRSGYTDAYDFAGVGYNSAVYYANTPVSYRIKKAEGTSYDYVLRSLYEIPTLASTGSLIASATAKPVPVDADILGFADTAASNVLKKMTFSDLKAFLKTYFDTLYLGDSMTFANKTISGVANVAPDTEVELCTYTVPAGKKLQLLSGAAESDGDARWILNVNGLPQARARSAHQDRNVSLYAPIELAAGDVLSVLGKNVTIQGQTNEIAVWLHANEVTL